MLHLFFHLCLGLFYTLSGTIFNLIENAVLTSIYYLYFDDDIPFLLSPNFYARKSALKLTVAPLWVIFFF